MAKRKLVKRNIGVVYGLFILTLFIVWPIVWFIQSKRDINAIAGEDVIPNSILMFIPIVNLYWIYKYCAAFSEYVKKDDNTMLWFIVTCFAGIVTPFFVQQSLNEYIDKRAGSLKRQQLTGRKGQAAKAAVAHKRKVTKRDAA